MQLDEAIAPTLLTATVLSPFILTSMLLALPPPQYSHCIITLYPNVNALSPNPPLSTATVLPPFVTLQVVKQALYIVVNVATGTEVCPATAP